MALLQDGDRFWRMPECYIRGSTIKYMRIPDEVIDMVKEEMMKPKGRGDPKGRGGANRGRGLPGRGQLPVLFLDYVISRINSITSKLLRPSNYVWSFSKISKAY